MSQVRSIWQGNVLVNTRTQNQIGAAVAEAYGITVQDLKGRDRTFRIAHARQEAMWLMSQELNLAGRPKYSRRQIGNWMNRDHSTVSFGCKAHALRNGLPFAARKMGGFVCNSFAHAEFVA